MFTDTTKAFSLTLFGEGGGDGAGVSAATAATASDAGEQTRAIERRTPLHSRKARSMLRHRRSKIRTRSLKS